MIFEGVDCYESCKMARGSRKPRVAIHEVESKQFGSEIKNCGSTGNIVNLFFFNHLEN